MEIKIPNKGRRIKKPLIIVDEFIKGTVTLLDEARLTRAMAKETVNLIQAQDGLWTQRWGRANYGVTIPGEDFLDGAEEYVLDEDTRIIIAVGGTTGKFYKSIDAASWTELTGAVFTPGNKCFFMQIDSVMFVTNGVNSMARYDGGSTMASYAALSAPGVVTPTRNVLTAGAYTQYYQVTALNQVGETVGSTEISITTNKKRDSWNGSTESINLAWADVAGATRYQIYWSDESGYEAYIDSVTISDYTDDASMQQNPYVVVPNDNTTSAPKFRQMELSGNRIWGTQDTDNPYRVHFSGVGQFITAFSEWYGGGWVDLDKGGRDMPVSVVHFRTGKGDPAVTVLCNSPEGQGTTWQITLESVTVGETSFTVPIPIKIVGSIGTTSPSAVIKMGDDILFPNKQGMYSLMNAPLVQNVLSTREKSQLIRPSYRGLNQALLKDLCGIYYDAKAFISGAVGSSADTTFIYDAERKNWNWSWNFGAKQWLKVTDVSGTTHLLYVPPEGGQLVEVSANFNTDFGQPFNTSYISGLLPFDKDDTTFAKVKECVFTLGRLKGTVQLEVLGIDAKKGFSSVGSRTVTDTGSNTDFANDLFGDYEFSEDVDIPKTFAQANIKKRVKVGKKLNKIQIHVYSTAAGTEYSLLNFQVRGSMIPTGLPNAWK